MAALEESIAAVKGKSDGKARQTGEGESQAEKSRAEKSRRQETLQSQILEVAAGGH